MAFVKATKAKARLRMGLMGTSGSGKTFTSLRVAKHLAGASGRVAVIDTERGSASKYADQFEFDVDDSMPTFAPEEYVKRIHEAEKAGYNVIIIDSLSHAWSGKGGALEMVDNEVARSRAGNSFAAWRTVTPEHNSLVEAMLQSSAHIIVTMRTKTEYVLQEDERGKKVPRKIGMAPVQRDGMEYEFDIVGDLDVDNRMSITKSRCPLLTGKVFTRPGEDFAEIVRKWLEDGADIKPTPAPIQTPASLESDPLVEQIKAAFAAAGFPWSVGSEALAKALKAKKLPKPDETFTGAMIAAIVAGKYDKLKPKPGDITTEDVDAAMGGVR